MIDTTLYILYDIMGYQGSRWVTSWWRHRVQISVEIHLNEQAQEQFHLDRKVRRYFDWVNVVNKAIKTAMWFHSTWMRCVLKRNRSWGFNAFQFSVCDENKERLDEKTKFRMHLRNRFFFLASVRAGRRARYTDFHLMLVLLGGICLPEQDAWY